MYCVLPRLIFVSWKLHLLSFFLPFATSSLQSYISASIDHSFSVYVYHPFSHCPCFHSTLSSIFTYLPTLHALQWFEERTQQIESLDAQLRKLHAAMEGLVSYRRELAMSTAAFAKATAVLSSVEEHSSLSRALHQLSESTERTHTIHHAQVLFGL